MSQAMPGRKKPKKAKTKAPAEKKTNGRSQLVAPLREKLGLTQQEFATLLGLSTVSVSRWEHKHTQPTDSSRALLGLLARALVKKPAPKIVANLRAIPGTNELGRIIELVHLGD